jgi:hypothetical protein
MAVVLKQIMIGTVTNTTVTGTAPAGKVWMVKDIRLVNKHASTPATLNVTVGPSANPRSVSPQNMSLGPGQMYQDDGEFVLNSLDVINIVAAPSGVNVEYLVSGLERDQS